MKTILLFISFLTLTAHAQDKVDGVYFWKNHAKKIFNFAIEPKVEVELTELNTGDDKYHAMMNLRTVPWAAMETVNTLAGNYKPVRVSIDMLDMDAKLRFADVELLLEIYNTPTGPSVDQAVFLSKKQYLALLDSGKVTVSFAVKAKPLIMKTVESVELDPSICKDLQINGNKLHMVMENYNKEMEQINRRPFKYASTKTALLKSLDQECFGDFKVYATSFKELMDKKVKVKSEAAKVFGSTKRESYSSETLSYSLVKEL